MKDEWGLGTWDLGLGIGVCRASWRDVHFVHGPSNDCGVGARMDVMDEMDYGQYGQRA